MHVRRRLAKVRATAQPALHLQKRRDGGRTSEPAEVERVLTRCRRHGGNRGFTLAELMVVVVIAGALAVTAVNVMRNHVDSARTIEGLTMVQSIRAAQERYRSEHGTYLDVSRQGSFYPDDPTPEGVGSDKRNFFRTPGSDAHADNSRWLELNPTVTGPVRFGYLTTAGLPGEVMTETAYAVPNLDWPDTEEPWYVIEAVADVDEDGVVAYYVASSINGEVFRANEGE